MNFITKQKGFEPCQLVSCPFQPFILQFLTQELAKTLNVRDESCYCCCICVNAVRSSKITQLAEPVLGILDAAYAVEVLNQLPHI
jgi:hypothetical protein